MNVMKRLLYILSLSVILFSCQKEYSYEGGAIPTSTYYITATVNGTPMAFNFDGTAAYTLRSGLNALELSSFAVADPSNNTSITLDISYDTNPPGVGTYTDQTNDYFVTGQYDFNSQDSVYTAGQVTPSPSPLTITISSIANNVVTGTFSGAFYPTSITTGLASADYILISDGTFRLPLQ